MIWLFRRLGTEKPEKWGRGFNITLLFTISLAVVGFAFGVIAAVADPGGWEAWRVGLLIASIFAFGSFVLGALCTAVWVGDP